LRIAKYADGWVSAAGGPLEHLRKSIKTLKEVTEAEDELPCLTSSVE